jgi:hypothetical protein
MDIKEISKLLSVPIQRDKYLCSDNEIRIITNGIPSETINLMSELIELKERLNKAEEVLFYAVKYRSPIPGVKYIEKYNINSNGPDSWRYEGNSI